MTQRFVISFLIVFAVSIFSAGCAGDNPGDNNKSKWGSAKFGEGKWNQ